MEENLIDDLWNNNFEEQLDLDIPEELAGCSFAEVNDNFDEEYTQELLKATSGKSYDHLKTDYASFDEEVSERNKPSIIRWLAAGNL